MHSSGPLFFISVTLVSDIYLTLASSVCKRSNSIERKRGKILLFDLLVSANWLMSFSKRWDLPFFPSYVKQSSECNAGSMKGGIVESNDPDKERRNR